MPNYSDSQVPVFKKSADLSIRARLEGKNLHDKIRHTPEEHTKILSLYSKSIAYAPNDSEELALGYFQRSFFLSHLNKYQQSVTDLDRALKITKSNLLKAKMMCHKMYSMKSMNLSIPQSFINEAEQMIESINDDLKMKSKLKDLIIRTTNQKIGNNNIQYEKANSPSMDPNPNLPATSTAIHLEYDMDFGRHFQATRDIMTGEILIIEHGYIVVPNMEHIYLVCSFCMNFSWTGIPCQNCPCVLYCSEQCREAAWKSYHDLECPILMLIFEDIFTNSNLCLTLRMFIKGLKEDPNGNLNSLLREFFLARQPEDGRSKGFKNHTFCSDSIRSIFSLSYLEYNVNSIHNPSLQKLLLILNATFEKQFCSSKFYQSLQNLNVFSFEKFFINMFSLTEVNMNMYNGNYCSCNYWSKQTVESHDKDCILNIGSIIGACQSLINHSCVPNTSVMFKDGKMILFAIRPIATNEQIFYSYGPTYRVPPNERQKFLFCNYYFQCKCIACEEQWYLPRLDFKTQFPKISPHFEFGFLREVIKVLGNAENNRQLLYKTDMKKIIHILICKISEIYENYLLKDASEIGSSFTDCLSDCYELYYGGDVYMPGDSKKK